MTESLALSASNLEAAAQRCAAALRRPGAVLLVPTETVYGLVCRASDAAARERIYALKHRSGSKQLALFVADYRKLAECGVVLNDNVRRLAERYCPGPITIIAPASDGTTVGFRTPDHPLILRILALAGEPLCNTSANRSGMPNALTVAEALGELDGEVELAVDAGPLPAGTKASTVVDCTREKIAILRQGALIIEGTGVTLPVS